jgi:ABC-type bacteriocin/lantibiotic exporter with double-glycine peptidase domain
MKSFLFEQLVRRIEGDRQAMNQAADIFRGMIDRKMWRQLTQQHEIPTDIYQLEETLYQQQIFFRELKLEGRWWATCSGKILAFTTDGDVPVILTPHFSDYSFIDPKTGKRIYIRKNADMIKPEAFALCYPLPDKKITIRSFIWYALKQLNIYDYAYALLACLGVTLLTMFTPYVNKLLFNEVIPSGDSKQLMPIAILLFSAAAGLVMVQLTRNLIVVRMKDKLEYAMQAPLMSRLLMMPTSFFKKYAPGDLSNRILTVVRLSSQITEDMLSIMLTFMFTAVLFIQFFTYGGPLLYTGIFVLGLYMLIIYIQFYYWSKVQTNVNTSISKLKGLVFSLVSGAQKIRTNGAEIRAFRHWAMAYEPSDPFSSRHPLMFTISSSLSYNARLLPMIVTMLAAWHYGLGLSDYIAYCSVMLIATDAVEQFQSIIKEMSLLIPEIKLCEPILQTPSEVQANTMMLKDVSGNIDISGLKFRYNDDMPYLFNGLNLKINAGDYVALVGPSGCGKTTLVRLLLGFEQPESGSIFYDQHNLDDISKPSLRQNCVSICLQDGNLVEGTIRDNILFGNTGLSDDDVWEAVRMVALEDDINRMPHGIDTYISADGQGVSGGQRQRIMIARAMIRKPKILFLDEATSALDNISQHIILKNLAKMKCTRITIAHRMSTIRECNRIIVLNNGRVAEDGSYEELMAKGGLLSEIIKRQKI